MIVSNLAFRVLFLLHIILNLPHLLQYPILCSIHHTPIQFLLVRVDINHRRVDVAVAGKLASQDYVPVVLSDMVGYSIVPQRVRGQTVQEFRILTHGYTIRFVEFCHPDCLVENSPCIIGMNMRAVVTFRIISGPEEKALMAGNLGLVLGYEV